MSSWMTQIQAGSLTLGDGIAMSALVAYFSRIGHNYPMGRGTSASDSAGYTHHVLTTSISGITNNLFIPSFTFEFTGCSPLACSSLTLTIPQGHQLKLDILL